MNKKVYIICGPTASGKTGISVELAKLINGEVISADSMQIYKEMSIGTAIVTEEEKQGVPHHMLSCVEPNADYSVALYKQDAERCLEQILNSGKTPVICGGTGLYIDALIFDYSFSESAQKNCSDRKEMCSRYKVFGIKTDTKTLRERLCERANKMFTQELYDETAELVEKYGWENQAMKSNVYQFAWKYMQGELSRKEAIQLNVYDDWHLAKRQKTWFKRNPNILWLPLDKIKPAVIKCIQDEQRK